MANFDKAVAETSAAANRSMANFDKTVNEVLPYTKFVLGALGTWCLKVAFKNATDATAKEPV